MFIFAWIFTHLVVFFWIQFYISSTLLFPNISKYDTFQICTLLPTLHDLHQEMKPTNLLVPFGLSVVFSNQPLGFVATSKCWAQDSEWLWKRVFNLHNLDNCRHGVPWWTAVGQGFRLEMGYLIKRWTPTYLAFIDISYNTRFFLKFICVEHFLIFFAIHRICMY